MAKIECLHCFKEVDMRATKCPHCKMGLNSPGSLELVTINWNEWRKGKFFWSCVFAPFLLLLIPLFLGHFFFPWMICLVGLSEVIVWIGFLKPGNMQLNTLIGFLTLIAYLATLGFVGLGTLWQKESFDLRNRPFLQILSNDFKIEFTGWYRKHDSSSEPQLKFTWPFFNHGPVPANIKDIRIQGHLEENKVETGEAVVIGAYMKDRLEQWESLDVFPSTDAGRSNMYVHSTIFYLNVNDVKNLIGVDLDRDSILKDSLQKPAHSSLFLSPYLQSKSVEQLPDFNFTVQFVYHALGETEANKKPYFYWVSYKHRNGVFYPTSSGTEEKIPRKS